MVYFGIIRFQIDGCIIVFDSPSVVPQIQFRIAADRVGSNEFWVNLNRSITVFKRTFIVPYA